jgi:predicted N-acetyltransferase YhbS
MSNLSNEQLDALLALAKAATPGNWRPVIDASFAAVAVGDRVVCGDMYNHRDASFIAAASPATITALVQQLQEARRDAERYRSLEWTQEADSIGPIFVARVRRNSPKTLFNVGLAIDAAMSKERQP